jgi:nucleoside-diphosphate-sugar epimerase
MPRALITGAAGFIGGGLVRRLLAEGWEVHALLGRTCRRETLADVAAQVMVHDHDGSLDSMVAILQSARPDVTFHLASLFLSDHRPGDVDALITSNILLSTQLAEAMAATGARRLVNTGTSWQHFCTVDYRPVNLYAATKQACEDILAYYHDAQGLSCLTLKLYDTYGPGDQRRKLINLLLDAARTGEPLALSPGEQEVELTHLDDVTAAFARAADLLLHSEAPLLAAYLVPGTRLTVRELVAQVIQATGRPIDAEWGGRPYRPREVMVPVASADRCLPNWAPEVELEAGLAACLQSRKNRGG